MKSNYRKLGDFIEQTEERNKDLAISLSQGICNLKYFQNPRQVAENSSADKIVRTGWFAYNRATTRNGDKISIAYRDKEDCTVSASYLTFKIKDENLLNPYYLMLWFKRPEFDRYARFKSHGSAHEYFEWEEMCDVMLPIPSIEEQRKIFAEYQSVDRRIENNRRLIAKLDETAQTICRNMFVDNIDPENLPQGWRMGTIGEFCECNVDSYTSKDNWSIINYLDSSSVTKNQFEDYRVLDPNINEIPSRAKRKVKENDFIISTVRPNLKHYGLIKGDLSNVLVSTAFAVIRSINPYISNELIYLWATSQESIDYLHNIAEMSKATYPSVIPEDILKIKVVVPPFDADFKALNNQLKALFDFIYILNNEIRFSNQLLSLLLSKLSKIN